MNRDAKTDSQSSPPRRRSLLVDYSKNRAKSPQPTTPSLIRLSLGIRPSSIRRLSNDATSLGRLSSHHGGSCHHPSSPQKQSRQPLNLYEPKKVIKREPSLLLEKRSGHRVSTVLELDLEDLGDLSDSSEEEEEEDEVSIQVMQLEEEAAAAQEHKPRRRHTDHGSTSSLGSSYLDDSDVYFALRRTFALPVRSSTFDATTCKSSTQRLNDSLLQDTTTSTTTNTHRNGNCRRSQLALARAMHNSMSKLIVDLEKEAAEEEEEPIVKSSSKPTPPPKTAVPDRRSLLAKTKTTACTNSLTDVIHGAVADTMNWLVQSSAEPVQTLQRASSLRDLLALQKTLSSSHRNLMAGGNSRPSAGRSKSSRNLMGDSDLSLPMTSLSRSKSATGSYTSLHSKTGVVPKTALCRSKSANGVYNTGSPSSNSNSSPTRTDQLRDFRRRSNHSSRLLEDLDDSSGTVDHQRRMDNDSGGGSSKDSSNNNNNTQSISPQRSTSKRALMASTGRGSSRSNLMTSKSPSRRNLLKRGSSRNLGLVDKSPSRRNLMGKTNSSRGLALEKQSSKRSLMSKGSSRTNLMEKSPSRRNNIMDKSPPPPPEKPPSRRNLLTRGSSKTSLLEDTSSRRNLMARGNSRSNLMATTTERSPSRRNLLSKVGSVERTSSRRNLMGSSKSPSRRNLMARQSSSRSNLVIMEDNSNRNGLLRRGTSQNSLMDLRTRLQQPSRSVSSRCLVLDESSGAALSRMKRAVSSSSLRRNGGTVSTAMHMASQANATWSNSSRSSSSSTHPVMTLADNSHFVTGSRIRRL